MSDAIIHAELGKIVFWLLREKRVRLDSFNAKAIACGLPALESESFIKLAVDAAVAVGAELGLKPKLVKRSGNTAIYRMVGETIDAATKGEAVPSFKLEQETSFEASFSGAETVKYLGSGEFAGRMSALVEAWRGTVHPDMLRAYLVAIIRRSGVSLRETGGVYHTTDSETVAKLAAVVKDMDAGVLHVCPVGGAEWAGGVKGGVAADLESRLEAMERDVDALECRTSSLMSKAAAVMEVEALAAKYGALLEDEAMAAALVEKARAIQSKIAVKSADLAMKAAVLRDEAKAKRKLARRAKSEAEKSAEYVARREGGIAADLTADAKLAEAAVGPASGSFLKSVAAA